MFYPIYIFDDDPDYEIFCILEFEEDDTYINHEGYKTIDLANEYVEKWDLFNDKLEDFEDTFEYEWIIDNPELLKTELHELGQWIMLRFWDWWDKQ